MKLYSRIVERPVPKELRLANGIVFRTLYGAYSEKYDPELVRFTLNSGYKLRHFPETKDYSLTFLYTLYKNEGYTFFTGRGRYGDRWFAIFDDDVIAHVLLTFS